MEHFNSKNAIYIKVENCFKEGSVKAEIDNNGSELMTEINDYQEKEFKDEIIIGTEYCGEGSIILKVKEFDGDDTTKEGYYKAINVQEDFNSDVTIKKEAPDLMECKFERNSIEVADVKIRSTIRTQIPIYKGKKSIKCDDATSNPSASRRPRPINTDEKPHKCHICDYKTPRKETLLVHIRVHTGEKPLKCNFCDYATSHRSTLRTHLITHTGVRPYKCNSCDYAATQKAHLDDHKRSHLGEKPFHCSLCDFRAAVKSSLQRHLKTHTRDSYKCTLCDYVTTVKLRFEQHLKRPHRIENNLGMRTDHTDEKPFKCSFCAYSASSSSHLADHERTHTGSKPFQCEYCNVCFRQRSHLRDHIMIHTGEKKFKCDYCSFATIRNSNLKNHMRMHTGEKPFQCEFCPHKTAEKSGLVKHTRIHFREKPVK